MNYMCSHTVTLRGRDLRTRTIIIEMNIEYVNNIPYFPGAASLFEELDKKILVYLRDGRQLVGILRSYDQYLNLIMEDTYERILLPGASEILLLLVPNVSRFAGKYCDVPLGLYIVRGDSITLFGDVEGSVDIPSYQRITPEQLSQLNETIQVEGEKIQWDFES